MNESGPDQASYPVQAWAAAAILAGLAVFVLGLAVLGAGFEHLKELQFVCDEFNCVEDLRSFAARHVGLLAAFMGAVLALVVSAVGLRLSRTRV